MSVIVSQINIFPIKSCRGISVPSGIMTRRGFEFDRQWMIVTQEGKFLTQRQLPMMSQILPQIILGNEPMAQVEMRLSAPGMSPLKLASSTSGVSRQVVVWDDTCEATDEGDTVAEWLSKFLKTNCRLVRFSESFVRTVDEKYAKTDEDQVGFADGFPFLLISENSLEDLNERMPQVLPMNRFRPNIVVKGCDPYAEDTWKTVNIGDARLHVVKPCARCVITCTDQDTSKVGVEPLRTLSGFRNDRNKILFGQNLVPETLNQICVGDPVEVLN
jgi:uncharacterized protein